MKNQRYGRQIKAGLEKLLVSRSPSGALGNITMAFVIYGTFSQSTGLSPFLVTICAIITVLNLLRFLISKMPADILGNQSSRPRLLRTHLFTIYCTAVCWMTFILLILTKYPLQSFEALFALLIISGITAASTSSLSPQPKVALIYCSLILWVPLVFSAASIFSDTSTSINITLIPVLFLAHFLFLANQILIYGKDLKRSLQNEAEAVQNLQTLEGLFDAFPGFVSLIDKDMRYRVVNKAVRDKFSGVDFLGKKIGSFGSPPDFIECIEDFIRSGKDSNSIEINNEKLTSEPLLMTTTKILGDFEGVLIVSLPLGKIKKLEASMLESSRLASLGEMAGGIAHEINNPLAIIKSKSSLLRRKIDDPSMDKNFFVEELERIESTCGRIVKIVNGLRTFSRNGKKDPFKKKNLKALIDDVLALCHERLRNHGIMIEIDVQPNTEVLCREVQIGQVVLNILNNAYDAIHDQPNAWIRIDASILENEIEISVMDSGPGIPPGVAEKIMQPFFTTKDVGKGTGLGLSVSQAIVDEHGGRLYLDLTAKNTRFVFTIPLQQKVSSSII